MSEKKIDDGLYSRQLYVIDRESMSKVMKSNILIIGLGGLGVEIAKNIILTGVQSVTLYDTENTSYLDLASQFYLSESDIGRNRAEVSIAKLSELNNHVNVKLHTGELNEEFLSTFTVIVATDVRQDQLLEINNITRKHGIKFIFGELRGAFVRSFYDFGDKFEVVDVNGEPAQNYTISSFTVNGDKTIVTLNDDTRLGLDTGDFVRFSEVKEHPDVNNIESFVIEKVGPFSFTINGIYDGPSHVSGYVHEVKLPKTISFEPLSQQIEKPKFLEIDWDDKHFQIHLGFLALHKFWKDSNHLPQPQNVEHYQSLLSIAKNFNEQYKLVEEVSEKIIQTISFTCIASINPLAAFLGGVIAQEILKGVTGKFTPVQQWLNYNILDAIPEGNSNPDDFLPKSCRYDSNIVVFGSSFQQTINDLKYFLVGSGAIGCEMLKNWAMLGLGCGNGEIQLTDLDNIERSNLNRQFLFRDIHIGEPKSKVAAEAARGMNPSLNIKAHTLKVGEETENFFNDKFYESLDGVCNALDNVDARVYVDGRCIHYKLPLLESGTLGTKANVQVVVPFLTESYSMSSTRDPPEKSIPMCTLHHFPNRIEHTIQWSRDEFEGLYKSNCENVNLFLSDPDYLTSLEKQNPNHAVRLATIKSIYTTLITEKPTSFEHCISWARHRFEEFFSNKIKQLLYNFPLDLITSEGLPFWSGTKRAPKVIEFNPDDELHIDFILAAANIRAANYGLKGSNDTNLVREVAIRTVVPPFTPAKGVTIPTDDKSAGGNDQQQQQPATVVDSSSSDLQELTQALVDNRTNYIGFQTFPTEFEKDDDSNYHIDFISACANLRAINYGIPTSDRHAIKGIAGKIIPAMVTTTAMITGLVCLELLKVVQKKPYESYKNAWVNLALPLISFTEPVKPATTKVRDDWEWNLWDRFEVEGPLDLKQLIKHFKDEYKLDVTMISAGMILMYAFFMKKPVLEDRYGQEISALYEKISQKKLHENETSLVLTICASRTEDGEDVDVPWVCYRIPRNNANV